MSTVDIIIPAYNAARFLPAAIQSVEGQTFPDWQIVLVDDGSTDDTKQVVAPFLARLGSKLKCIHKPNGGLPAARNTAIRNSSSEFIALLDADDVWLPERLEASIQSFEGHPEAGLSYGFIQYIDEEGTPLEWVDSRQENGAGRIATHIYTRKVNLPCPTITFRRKCVDEVGLFDETMRATEDRDLWLRIAMKYEVRVIEQVISYYRLSSNSMTRDTNRMLQAQLQFVEKHYGSPGCGWRPRRMALSSIYKQRADALSAQQKGREAMKCSLRALWLDPLNLGNLRATASLLGKWG